MKAVARLYLAPPRKSTGYQIDESFLGAREVAWEPRRRGTRITNVPEGVIGIGIFSGSTLFQWITLGSRTHAGDTVVLPAFDVAPTPKEKPVILTRTALYDQLRSILPSLPDAAGVQNLVLVLGTSDNELPSINVEMHPQTATDSENRERVKLDVVPRRRDLGWALAQLREGSRLCRAGWNGKGQWIELQTPDTGSKMTLPYIFIRTVSGDRVPWLASQSDMLAEDWQQFVPDSPLVF